VRFPPAYSLGDTTVYLFTDATSHSVPCPHRFVKFCVTTQQNVDRSDRQTLFFFRAAQTVRRSPKLTHERHILGMWNSPELFAFLKLCRLICTPITNIPQKYPF